MRSKKKKNAADELMREALGQSVAPKIGGRFSDKATLKGRIDVEQRGTRRAGK